MAKDSEKDLVDVDFSDLIMGFSSSALAYLGFDIDTGAHEGTEVNLDLAQQNINVIAMLKVKTKGNLSVSEEKLIEGVLADLQLKFVEAKKRKKR